MLAAGLKCTTIERVPLCTRQEVIFSNPEHNFPGFRSVSAAGNRKYISRGDFVVKHF